MRSDRTLRAYLWLVVVIAAPVIVMAAIAAVRGFDARPRGTGAVIVVVFCLVLIAGELWPIPVARGKGAGDDLTVSSTFGFGLLFIAPVFIAMIAQAVALTADALWRRRPLDRLAFNIAQYALAYWVARVVYAAVARIPFTPVDPAPLPALLPSAAAGTAFLLVNNTLVAIAVAISVQMRLGRVLLDDLKWQITTSAPLLGLGPLTVQAMMWTPASIVLLLMPIIALHHSGTMLMNREREARRDALTGLANRTVLHMAGAEALQKSTGGTALLLLDLDHFKEVNDTLGHGVGDQVLIAVAQRLPAAVGPLDLVARLGGDEFVVLARGVDSDAEAVELANRICSAVNVPVALQGVKIAIGCSVGVALGPAHGDSVQDLLRCADVALYQAKSTRGAVAVYDGTADRHSAAELGLQADLVWALDHPGADQVWVAYQPQLSVASGRATSVECLVRWRHPTLGEIEPDHFIPIAEGGALIGRLFEVVLDTALGQLIEWDRSGLVLTASVNLSARQLSNVGLPETIRRCLDRHGIDSGRLILEVTETRLMSDPARSVEIIAELRKQGVQISIDDFGTGYSSLAYLQRLSADELKIDRSFVQEIDDPGVANIVRSTIDRGHNLGYRVVAEGVEGADTAARLADMGCDVLQGFLLGGPVAAPDLPAQIDAMAWVPGRRALRDVNDGRTVLPINLRRPLALPRRAVHDSAM